MITHSQAPEEEIPVELKSRNGPLRSRASSERSNQGVLIADDCQNIVFINECFEASASPFAGDWPNRRPVLHEGK